MASPIGKGLKRPPAPRKKIKASGTGAASGSDEGAEAPRPRSGSENRQRSHVVRMRLDDDELVKLDDRATASGLAVGAYLRAAALKSPGVRAKPRASVDRELLARANADLNRVGNNINQIAAALNRGVGPPLVIGEAMAELRSVLAALRRAAGYDSQG